MKDYTRTPDSRFQNVGITNISLNKSGAGIQILRLLTIRMYPRIKVVYDGYTVAKIDQLIHQMRAYETRSAGHENVMFFYTVQLHYQVSQARNFLKSPNKAAGSLT